MAGFNHKWELMKWLEELDINGSNTQVENIRTNQKYSFGLFNFNNFNLLDWKKYEEPSKKTGIK